MANEEQQPGQPPVPPQDIPLVENENWRVNGGFRPNEVYLPETPIHPSTIETAPQTPVEPPGQK